MDWQGAPLRDELAAPRVFGALGTPTAQPTDPRDLIPFASLFTPAEAIGVGKTRIGSPSDGGYVMLDDFAGPSVALSLGVGDETSWDRHIAGLGAVVHQYDHTVDEPEGLPEAVRFHRKQIVDVADGVGVTLADALTALDAGHAGRRAILKIDIEGDEWAVLDAVPDDVLARFDQIVGEYHDFERVGDAAWLARASRVMTKLDRLFQVVHVHGNNHRPIMLIGGTPFPWVLEVTHANRQRYGFRPTDERFPTELDRPNHPNRPDLWLGSFAFRSSRPDDAARPDDRAPSPMRREGVVPLVSHARNGEDVVLHRALREIEEGHYVDVGARDPEVGSVTKVLHDRGWSGINVEASKARFERFATARPRDRNLHVAAAARAGLVRFREDAEAPGAGETGIDIPALSLADICRDLPFDETHVLRIDVGGAERDVLLGADFAAFRPWIVVVATPQSGGTDSDAGWWNLLEGAGYDRTLFDGVNLWFLAREHAHLRDRLEAPANVRDGYVPARLDRAVAETAAAHGRTADLSVEIMKSKINSAVQAEERAAVELAYKAERAAIEHAARDARARVEVLQSRLDGMASEAGRLAEGYATEVQRLKDEISERRVTLQIVQERLERELDGVRRDGRLEAERHLAEIAEARDQLARLAHFKAQGELLGQISDLTGAGSHLEERGAELVKLRAGLIAQADAWQTEVEQLQAQLGDALARSDLLYASTSWRVMSPLRGLRRATHILRREPHRLPGLMRHRARAMLGHPDTSVDLDGSVVVEPVPSPFETGTRALVSIAARLDGEMAIIADLLGSVSSVVGDDALDAAGPCYGEARIDERLTRWILADVVRQRRAAL